jgi:hypothetical protein
MEFYCIFNGFSGILPAHECHLIMPAERAHQALQNEKSRRNGGAGPRALHACDKMAVRPLRQPYQTKEKT